MEDISKNVTRCNLRSYGRFSQARSQIIVDVMGFCKNYSIFTTAYCKLVEVEKFCGFYGLIGSSL